MYWINNTILTVTALVLLWYTRETAAMKAEMVKQNRLLTRPILVLEFDEHKPFLNNEGNGPALNASVTEFEVRSSLNAGSQIDSERFDFVLPVFITMGSKHELRVVPTKQCRSIISTSYMSQLLVARGVKSGVYKAGQGGISKPALLCRDYRIADV